MKNVFNRGPLLFLLCVVLVCLCYFAGSRPPWLDLKDCVRNPETHDGRRVTYIREPQVFKITPDGFIMRYGSGTIPVIITKAPPGLREGEYIGLTAIYHKEGYLTAEKLIIAKNRRFKILFSVIPVFLVTGLMCRFFKWNPGTLQLEMRHA